MHLISKIIRYIFRQFEALLYKLRVIKLKLLYPEITMDFKTKIERGCSIICVDGGKLTILNSHISFGTLIKADAGSTLSICSSFVGRNCVIAAKEKILIKDKCLIAEMVVIRDQDHDLDPLLRNSFITSPVEINENVWIGSKATVLKGVTIGRNSVVATSAVVKSDIPPQEIWGGIPARKLKNIPPTLSALSTAELSEKQRMN
jgi:carbonic anhydrase/acetyltransferase-like protein (isoleucine patch superfamily)